MFIWLEKATSNGCWTRLIRNYANVPGNASIRKILNKFSPKELNKWFETFEIVRCKVAEKTDFWITKVVEPWGTLEESPISVMNGKSQNQLTTWNDNLINSITLVWRIYLHDHDIRASRSFKKKDVGFFKFYGTMLIRISRRQNVLG